MTDPVDAVERVRMAVEAQRAKFTTGRRRPLIEPEDATVPDLKLLDLEALLAAKEAVERENEDVKRLLSETALFRKPDEDPIEYARLMRAAAHENAAILDAERAQQAAEARAAALVEALAGLMRLNDSRLATGAFRPNAAGLQIIEAARSALQAATQDQPAQASVEKS